VILVLAGLLNLESHVFGMVVGGQVLWFVLVGAALWRGPREADGRETEA
jgi:hypothetical protein